MRQSTAQGRASTRYAAALAVMALVATLLPAAVFAAKATPTPTFVDYAQCANGQPPSTATDCPGGWINGILQASNSHYAEDQVVPQRAELNVPVGANTTNTVTFTFMARKGSAATHAYDSMATWNYTQTTADRCQGLAANLCVGGNPSTLGIPDDPQALEPHAANKSDITSGHMIPAGTGRVFTAYGATITDVSVPVHDCVATSSCADPTVDDYATFTVTYTVPDTLVSRNVQFLFGGHLALGSSGGSRTWGLGYGASNISGGPYHIKWTASDGASIGNRDNQIMGSAIIFNDTALATTPDPTSTTVPDTLNDSATLTGTTAGAGGTITFNLYGPSDTTCSGTALYTQTVTVNGSGTYSTTPGYLATTAGTWNWTADYSGDPNNAASSSACGDESVTVGKASPTFSTSASPTTSIVVGTATTVGDTATFSGGYNPSGSVTFALYSDSTCTTAVSGVSGSGSISSGVASYSTSWTPTALGIYYWKVNYAGDTNNNSYGPSCGGTNETLTVIKASPDGSTTPTAQIRDTFTISGGYNPTGTVDFKLFDNNTCSGTALQSDLGVALASGSATSKWMSVSSGTYYWQAAYSGDSLNNSKTICGEVTTVTLP